MKIEVPIRKRGHFTDEMSVGKSKKRGICIEKAQVLENKVLRFCRTRSRSPVIVGY